MLQANYIVGILTILEKESWLSRTEILARLDKIYLDQKRQERPSFLGENFPGYVDYWCQPVPYWTAKYLAFLRRTGNVQWRPRPGQFEQYLWRRLPVMEYALTSRGCYWRTRIAALTRNARTRPVRAPATEPARA